MDFNALFYIQPGFLTLVLQAKIGVFDAAAVVGAKKCNSLLGKPEGVGFFVIPSNNKTLFY